MNHIYRSIWNTRTGTFVAVSEVTKSGGKCASSGSGAMVRTGFALKALTMSLLMAFGANLYALPVDGVVAAGSASITSGAESMTINQSSQNVVLNWQSFNISQGQSVNFVQPNSSAVALNRMLGADPPNILGSLNANGQVFLINPNGILFGQGASVNVGGLVASTLNISDSDFMAGIYKFAGSGGTVRNQGSISADGGYVALLGANVSNQGMIAARLGTVALIAGEAVTLDVAGDNLIRIAVDQGAVNALVDNGGMIQADGGHVLLSAQAAGDLLHTVVNHTGIIQAQTFENHDGTIRLLGDMQTGTVNVAGTVDASAPNGGKGGFIDTSAARVTVADDTKVTTAAALGLTGSWLIDPTDYTIAATGGDITGALLSANLANTSITIQSISGDAGTAGNVDVNDTVSWSANKLTLNAQNNININTAMHASGTASLALEFGQGAVAAGNASAVNVGAAINLPAGENFSTRQGSDGAVKNYTVITSLGAAGSTTGTDLQGMNGNLARNYALGSNIDASATSGWNGGAGFTPIGNISAFTGGFDGLGHVINKLSINSPTVSNVGLFGNVNGGGIINVGIVDAAISGASYVGALVGNRAGGPDISNAWSSGTVSGTSYVGGLIGLNNGGNVIKAHSTAAVTGTSQLIGGLIGQARFYGMVSDSYATGAVNGNGASRVGGLIGQLRAAEVFNSYATGAVTGNSQVGGLIGFLDYWSGRAKIETSYSSGTVSGNFSVGGLVGSSSGSAVNSYWDVTTSGQGSSAGGIGLTTTQMQTASNFAGFNFTATPGATGNNWVMVNVNGTLNNAGGALGGTRPMLASEYSTTINNAHQLQLIGMNLAGNYTLGQNINAAATGQATDVWSGRTFIPVGNDATPFTGTINGQARTISNLNINLPSGDNVGLIGVANDATISNVALAGASVTGQNKVGALIGSTTVGSLDNSNATGGQVTGSNMVGGLVGASNTTRLNNSYSSNAVNGSEDVGGLIGWTNGGMMTKNNYATGNITGTGNHVGGLVGNNYFAHIIDSSYATGNVSGANFVGGLVGYNHNGDISKSYATGKVSGIDRIGGLVGGNYGTVSASFWNSSVNGGMAGIGAGTLSGSAGMTTAQMQTQANFTSATTANGNLNPGWDFANTWVQYDTHTNPLLRSFMTALTVTANDAIKTYDALGTTGGNGVRYSTAPNMSNLLGSLSYSSGINVGNSTITPTGLYSHQQGYLINFASGALTVNQADLTLSTSNVSKIYDGSTSATGTATVTAGTLFGTDAISGGRFAFIDKNVGTGNKTVTTTGVALNDGNGGSNYNITYANNTTSTISPKTLTVSGETALDKVFDGTTTATLAGGTLLGLVAGDAVALVRAGSFAGANVGNAIAVTASSRLSGADTGNYRLTQPTGLQANITSASAAPQNPLSIVIADAIASAVQATSTISSGDNMTVSLLSSGQAPSVAPIGTSTPAALKGLNITLGGEGVNLPPELRANYAADEGD